MKWQQVMTWFGSLAVAVALAVVFLFTTFQTSAEADRERSTVEQRLDRLETKIDRILEQTK